METATIVISNKEADLMQTFLDSDGEEGGGTVQSYTADFGGGIEAEIKVCKGDPPFVDAVLYDKGSEVQLMDVSDELLGEYLFYYDEKVYAVTVEEGMEIGS